MPMRTSRIIALAAAVFLAACANQKEPAENAVAKIEASLNEVRADAQKYAADQLKTVDESVNRLKQNLANKDYSGVVVGAPSVASAVDDLKSTVATAKADAEANMAAAQTEWNELSASVPPLVEKLQARVDQLTKTRKYPKGMDKAAFEAAKTAFENLKTEWTEAGNEFTSGQAGNAVRKARNAKEKAQELVNQLEVKV
jgi:DNA repair exonuclease SbcCD ATPase subunit